MAALNGGDSVGITVSIFDKEGIRRFFFFF
jgi:hypothetical protein